MEELTFEERKRRTFSESFKRKKIQEIETGQTKISEICKQYQLSQQSIYRWLKKFGNMKKQEERLIVETSSDTKKLIECQKRIAELERMLGCKQIELDFKEKMIEIAEEMYNVDIKKKLGTGLSNTSTKTETITRIH